MASLTSLTVEDSSPLITYGPAGSWSDSIDDPLLSSYSGSSYHVTSSQGATAAFTFVGTGVSLFGGLRQNYGTYSASLDGNEIKTGSAQAGQDSTRQLLASATGLSYGSHTLVFTNTGGGPIDIDSINFETGTAFASNDIDDANPAITYSPTPDAWQTNTDPGFFQNTLHFTQNPGAAASMKFTGGAVALYGTVSPNRANIVVNVDGQPSVNLQGGGNGLVKVVHPDVLLFYQGDLDGSEHTITLKGDSSQPGTGPFVDLDKVTVFTALSPPGGSSAAAVSSTSVTAPSSIPNVVSTQTIPSAISTAAGTAAAEITLGPSSSPSVNLDTDGGSHHTSTGVIVGSVFGALAALTILLATALLLFLRRRRQRHARVTKSMIAVSPVLPMQDKPMTPILPMQWPPRDMEKGNMGGLESTAFPFPAPKKALSSLRNPVPLADSARSSYHSRDASQQSNGSSVPLIKVVPVISAPQPRPNVARIPTPGISGSNAARPMRPSNRPPTIDFAHITEVPR